MTTKREKLLQDPRVQEAKQLIFQAIKDQERDVTGVKKSDPEKALDYSQALESLKSTRGIGLFYPYIGSGYGSGPFVELLDGSIKYDCICGIGVHYFGHLHPEIALDCIDASLSNTIMQGNLQQNIDSLELAGLLTSLSGLDHCFLTSSGAMACENALKLAFCKKAPANRILAFDNCFAGRTLALSQLTDRPQFRQGLPDTITVDYIPFCDSEKSIDMLKNHLTRNPGKHAVMAMELIQGEGGFNVGNTEIFKKICTILKEHDILVWIDEVQTFLRTYELFSFQQFELEQFVDIVSIGKSLQACATLYNEALAPPRGLLSQTFTASTTAICAGRYIVEQAVEQKFFGKDGKIKKLYDAFATICRRLEEKFSSSLFSGPYGIGSMVAFKVFDGDPKKSHAFLQKLFENGVIAFMAQDKVRFLLPVGVIEPHHLEDIMQIVSETLEELI